MSEEVGKSELLALQRYLQELMEEASADLHAVERILLRYGGKPSRQKDHQQGALESASYTATRSVVEDILKNVSGIVSLPAIRELMRERRAELPTNYLTLLPVVFHRLVKDKEYGFERIDPGRGRRAAIYRKAS